MTPFLKERDPQQSLVYLEKLDQVLCGSYYHVFIFDNIMVQFICFEPFTGEQRCNDCFFSVILTAAFSDFL